MRGKTMTVSRPRPRSWSERVDRLLRAAYADEPRFRESFLQVESARPASKVDDDRDCASADDERERPLTTISA
jgi:hypothetical protein